MEGVNYKKELSAQLSVQLYRPRDIPNTRETPCDVGLLDSWDFDALADGLQTGEHRVAFMREVEDAIYAKTHRFEELAKEVTPTNFFNEWVATVRTIALHYYSKQPPDHTIIE